MRGLSAFILGAVDGLFKREPKVNIETDQEGMAEHLKKLSDQEIRERAERRRKTKARKRKRRKNKRRGRK